MEVSVGHVTVTEAETEVVIGDEGQFVAVAVKVHV
jgi:hypothetical protein